MAVHFAEFFVSCERGRSMKNRQMPSYSSCQQCALLALCSVHIMSYSQSVLPPSNAFSALMVFSYGGIIFNCAAAVASLVIVDKIGSVPIWGARRSLDPPHAGWMSANVDILDRFGIGSSWGWIVGYCKGFFYERERSIH
ncbi:hypothetical protein IW261DRAFT_885096 [Armillaria novae-zelandiae]|uniref:Uncharacterized protein n=1 Tax=Armillaria novae-zelandiae TaxID=153914 RepID=A0AA39PJF0_9AGAR|nr:hypothetical protein IW261DRAFT_885096 [Armillaria novae-zelandiae]